MRGNGLIYGGRYRVDRELGRGHYAVSYLVTDLKTSRPCVLKLLREAGVPPEDARIFEAQAAILAKLTHPRLPTFVEYFVEGEGAAREHLLVTRFHPGESLERLVEKGRMLTEAQAITLLGRLVPVFTYLHSFDPPYVHRFLKPSNIILGPDGRPCLVDFHFAAEGPGWRAWERTPADEEGVAIDAPEVSVSGAVPASDIYALGMAVLFGMTGMEPVLLAKEIARSRLREVVKVGDSFAAILARMVEPSLEKRYPDAPALEADLARLGVGRVPGKPVPQPKPAAVDRKAEENRGAAPSGQRGLLWAAIALLVALAGGVIWFSGMQGEKPAGESLLVTPQAPQAPPAPLPPAESPAATATPGTAPGDPSAPAAPAVPPAGQAGQAAAPGPASSPAETGIVPVSPAPAPEPQSDPAATATTTADPVVAEGRLLFDGRLVTSLSLPAPLFWFRDETTKKVAKAQVDYADGAFTVRGLAPGRYGLSVRVDLDAGNPNIFPGDLNGWLPFTLEAGRPATLDVPLRKIMRLLQPVDNNAVIRGWDVPCGAGNPTPGKVVFAWEAVDPGASYEVRIDRLLCNRGYASAGRVFSHTTNDTWAKVDLPPSAEGECYSFRLSAVKGGRQIGVMSTHGKTGLGWDYKFSVAP